MSLYALLSTITLTGALAACGDDTPTGAGSSDDSDESWTSPLQEYLGGGPFGASGFTVAARVGGLDEQKERQAEDQVAACMRDQGFEYVPFVPDTSAADAFEEADSLDPDEYARQYGYGISTIGFGGNGEDVQDDPNEDIRAALSESAAEAYDQALWGDMSGGMVIVERSDGDGEEVSEGVTSDGEEGEPGCKQLAREDVYGEEDLEMPDFSEFDDLFDDLHSLEQRITSDPDMTAAVDAWSDCMAASGHSGMDSLDAPMISIMDRMSSLFEAAAEPNEPEGPDAPAGPDESAEDGDSTVETRLDPSQIDEDELAELRDDEIAVAVTDRECRSEHVDAVERDVRGAMEAEFVDANRDILERYRDEMAGTFG